MNGPPPGPRRRGRSRVSVLMALVSLSAYVLFLGFGLHLAGTLGLVIAMIAGAPLALIVGSVLTIVVVWAMLQAFALIDPKGFLEMLQKSRSEPDATDLGASAPRSGSQARRVASGLNRPVPRRMAPPTRRPGDE